MSLGKGDLVCDYCSESALMNLMTFIRRVELFNPNQQAERLFSEMFGNSIGKTLELGVQKPMAFLRCFLKSSHWMDAPTTCFHL